MRHELTSADLGVIRKALALVIQYERSELERTYRTVQACPRRAETEHPIADFSARKFPSTTDRDGRRGYANRREER